MSTGRSNGRPFAASTVMLLQALVLKGPLTTHQVRPLLRRHGLSRAQVHTKLAAMAQSGHLERTPETQGRCHHVLWQATEHARTRLLAQCGPMDTWPELPPITPRRWSRAKPQRTDVRRPRPEAPPSRDRVASVWAYADHLSH